MGWGTSKLVGGALPTQQDLTGGQYGALANAMTTQGVGLGPGRSNLPTPGPGVTAPPGYELDPTGTFFQPIQPGSAGDPTTPGTPPVQSGEGGEGGPTIQPVPTPAPIIPPPSPTPTIPAPVAPKPDPAPVVPPTTAPPTDPATNPFNQQPDTSLNGIVNTAVDQAAAAAPPAWLSQLTARGGYAENPVKGTGQDWQSILQQLAPGVDPLEVLRQAYAGGQTTQNGANLRRYLESRGIDPYVTANLENAMGAGADAELGARRVGLEAAFQQGGGSLRQQAPGMQRFTLPSGQVVIRSMDGKYTNTPGYNRPPGGDQYDAAGAPAGVNTAAGQNYRANEAELIRKQGLADAEAIGKAPRTYFPGSREDIAAKAAEAAKLAAEEAAKNAKPRGGGGGTTRQNTTATDPSKIRVDNRLRQVMQNGGVSVYGGRQTRR